MTAPKGTGLDSASTATPSSRQKMSSRLTALSSAAVLAIYTAGYIQTKAASDRVNLEAAQRRQAAPVAVIARGGTVPPAAEISTPTMTEAPAAATTVGNQTAAAPSAVSPATPPPPNVAAATSSAATTSTVTPSAPTSVAPATTNPTPAVAIPAAMVASAAASVASSAAPAATATPPAASNFKDGTFSGWGTSRHGDIEATIVVQQGKIASAVISQCYTRWPCSWVSVLPPQVITRQSSEVDFVSGATDSTNAFYYATVEAIKKAK